ncbi:hypothetical protein HHX47_DHR3000803 [Lentinula edodes]|nr:hypothetical protein HHX47_DHR3000803 [Lentinula edodes]
MLKDSLLEKLCNRIRENRVDGARELGERIVNDWVVETFPQSPSQQAIIDVLLEPILFDTLVDTERNSESHYTSLAHLMGSNLLPSPNDWMNQYILPLFPKEILPSNSKSSSNSKTEGNENENAAESSSTIQGPEDDDDKRGVAYFRDHYKPTSQTIQVIQAFQMPSTSKSTIHPNNSHHAELYLPEESNSGGNP